jgi:hypothetical protein
MAKIGLRLDSCFTVLSNPGTSDVVANCFPHGHEWLEVEADIIHRNLFDVINEIFHQERSIRRISTTEQLPLRLFYGGLTLDWASF